MYVFDELYGTIYATAAPRPDCCSRSTRTLFNNASGNSIVSLEGVSTFPAVEIASHRTRIDKQRDSTQL